MESVFSFLIATFVTAPLLGYILVFVIAKQLTKNHRSSVQLAIDISTILLIISVHFLIVTIWDKSFLWIILLGMISIAIGFALLHWKIKHEINLASLFKGFWRFNFLLFFSAYILLIIFGLIQRVSIHISLP
ncbi:DUF3397 domain-containing protein [Bacillus canaveralius]|uniref:DUF3397 domain-containing protein n=1 Tax=Bacillus canaveralius TaxID=1403243 RepID=A0A2N5GNT4_9BACI|nr:DUF3397 domain-containing protein [Bacillus canaveralius]PLR84109.1 DUF3397 domain-containing protein [Bacillus canaveralius]PLR96245.1 DUF3397 domain-containing protein [Bacillus canaveralius]